MDVFCTVEGQRLKIETPIKHFPRSSEDFVRFLFSFSEDWDGLLIFAQFRQFGCYSNKYLETVTVDGVSYQAATLPGWPKPGPLTLLLYGTGNETVIGTTNAVLMHIDATGMIDADVSDIDETLYQQLVNRVIGMENVLRLNAKYANTYHCVEDMQGDMELTEGMVARTVSYYRDNNLGGADYNISATAEVGAVALANGLYANIRGDKVYPEQFGAYRDGVTDDTRAIQKAIDTGRVVGLSAGTYAIVCGSTYNEVFNDSRFITTGSDGITFNFKYAIELPETKPARIEGDSAAASVLQFAGGSNNGYAFLCKTFYTNRAVLSDFTISANSQKNDGSKEMNGIFATYRHQWGASFLLQRINMFHLNMPMYVLSGYQAEVEGCTIRNCGGSVFSYGEYDHSLPVSDNTYPDTRFCNSFSFRNSFFYCNTRTECSEGSKEKDGNPCLYRGDTALFNMVHCQEFVFYNCAFQMYQTVFSSSRAKADNVCHACWFEGVGVIDALGAAMSLTDCKYVQVGEYTLRYRSVSSGINIDAVPGLPNVLRYNGDGGDSAMNDVVHGAANSALYAVYIDNKSIGDSHPLYAYRYFYPYRFRPNEAQIKVPFNTIVTEAYNTARINISPISIYEGAINVSITGELDVYVFGNNKVYAARYNFIKMFNELLLSDPIVYNNTYVKANQTAPAVITPGTATYGIHKFDDTYRFIARPLFSGNIYDDQTSQNPRIIGTQNTIRFGVYGDYVPDAADAATAPTSPAPAEGDYYHNTTDGKLYRYNGSAWTEVTAGYYHNTTGDKYYSGSASVWTAIPDAANAATAPTEPVPVSGDYYHNTTDGKLYTFDGSAWTEVTAGYYHNTTNGYLYKYEETWKIVMDENRRELRPVQCIKAALHYNVNALNASKRTD